MRLASLNVCGLILTGGSLAQQKLMVVKEYVELIVGTPGVLATGLDVKITPSLEFSAEGVPLKPKNCELVYTVELVVKKDVEIVEQKKSDFAWLKKKLAPVLPLFHRDRYTVLKCKWKNLLNERWLHLSNAGITYDVQDYITKFPGKYSFTWANGEKPRLYFEAFLEASSTDYAKLNKHPFKEDKLYPSTISHGLEISCINVTLNFGHETVFPEFALGKLRDMLQKENLEVKEHVVRGSCDAFKRALEQTPYGQFQIRWDKNSPNYITLRIKFEELVTRDMAKQCTLLIGNSNFDNVVLGTSFLRSYFVDVDTRKKLEAIFFTPKEAKKLKSYVEADSVEKSRL